MDGLLIVAQSISDQQVRRLSDERIPFVLVNARRDDLPLSSVDVDNVGGAGLAVEHLATLGHVRIGTLTGSAVALNSIHRLQGYREALARRGLPVEEEWIVEGNWSEESGYDGLRRLLGLSERPSAVFCSNDLMAIGALRAAADCSVDVPREMSIVGFDDIRLASFVIPRLTTIRQPIEETGRAAACILLDQLANSESPPQKIILSPQLIVRFSSAPREDFS